MAKILKRTGLALLILVGVLVLLFIVLAAWLTITQYSPEATEDISITENSSAASFSGNSLSVLTWNIGYAGLGDNADFFMDGGSSVRSSDQARVQDNLSAIRLALQEQNTDFVFLQEVDQNSTRTYHIDETAEIGADYARSAYALNYCCNFVPYPLPPIGKVTSGVMTLSDYSISAAQRLQLPLSFSWPVSVANLKRCMLVSRVQLENDKELVLINFHLEAYDDGDGKAAQTEMLLETLTAEYEKGNYVIAGGDFNQSFPGWEEYYPIEEPDGWVPGTLDSTLLPDGWQFAYDVSNPSCRSLRTPYVSGESQYYLIDGFILSPNISLNSVQTLNLDFRNSDHNPVRLDVTLE